MVVQKGGIFPGTLTVGPGVTLTVIGKVEEQLPSLIVTNKSGTDGELKSKHDGLGKGVPPASGSPLNQLNVTPPPEKIVLLSL